MTKQEFYLVYMGDGDDCPLQSDFQYYLDERTGSIVKESDLGSFVTVHKVGAPSENGQIRLAKISELEVDASELVQ